MLPQSQMGALDDAIRTQQVNNSLLYVRYSQEQDRDSAYEFLQRKFSEDAANEQKAEMDALARKQAEKEAKQAEKVKKRAVKSVANSAAGTIGRELGNTLGSSIGGKFGKKLGGNVGASLGRGILSTLFKL